MRVWEIAAANGQGWTQIGELLLAFVLTSAVGSERQFHGHSAGLRTQSIVGTASALFILVSKYGFGDVVQTQLVMLDPSRVAAQVVSGIGFLGAGLIITRRGAVRGLTTAAAVWEAAAIGMAAGAGLAVLALVVTALHFLIVVAYTPLGAAIATRGHAERGLTVTYLDGRGVLREVLAACTAESWVVRSLAIARHSAGRGVGDRVASGASEGGDAAGDDELVSVSLTLAGPGTPRAVTVLADIDGVVRVDPGESEDD